MKIDNRYLGLKSLDVYYKKSLVGTLAMTKDGKVAFSYGKEWLKTGFSISPLSLPLENRVFVPKNYHFDGLFGVFADSLPDAWGNLLLERLLKKHGIKEDINVLDRLALIGNTGMGALEYVPSFSVIEEREEIDVDFLYEECHNILLSKECDSIDRMYELAGSSGGARPKVMLKYNDEDWIIKFASHLDSVDIGKLEYDYSLCVKKCGIRMSDTHLFKSQKCLGYFGTKRFDRIQINGNTNKIHMISAAALLEADYRAPCLDYHSLMKLTHILTKNKEDVEMMFRIACFNVFGHNRDDHIKNFSFLYNDEMKMWQLAPAYDMTYSKTYYGEHTTTIDGVGDHPGEKELMAVAIKAGITKKKAKSIIDFIKNTVQNELEEYI